MLTKLENRIKSESLTFSHSFVFDNVEWKVKTATVEIGQELIHTNDLVKIFYEIVNNNINEIKIDSFLRLYLIDFTIYKGSYFTELLIAYEKRNGVSLSFDYYKDILVFSIISGMFAKIEVGDILVDPMIRKFISRYNG